ncbi:MAG: hypothetical protein M1836_001236 [Candelina mexicana]|nr:MAG: hypothetical protein M1836_001236 [Candelina mexicana]
MAYHKEDIEGLPEGCHHYQHVGEVPWDIQKYWQQRHSIFSKYDEGIQMTDDAWFGVTPEPVANKIAKHVSNAVRTEETILVDTFAGAGGNAIAFARYGRWQQICAIEKDPQLLKCARHNARIYGVEDNIEWFEGDCFEVLLDQFQGSNSQQCVIFASPPWGGPGYRSDKIFNLRTMQPYSLYDIVRSFSKISRDLAIYLPRTSDLRQLADLVTEEEKLDVVHYCMEGASKVSVCD